MTDTEQILEIARFHHPKVKWIVDEGVRPVVEGGKAYFVGRVRRDGSLGGDGYAPDYPNDLNAIWEAIEHGGPKVIKAMRMELFDICGQMRAHHATAREQCRGLLQHLGKWKE